MKTKTLLFILLSIAVGSLSAQHSSFLWASDLGSIGSDASNSVAIDSAGNVYVTGTFNTAPFYTGSTVLSDIDINAGFNQAFIAKYDAQGNIVWAKNAASLIGNVVARSIAVDRKGNVYVAGSYNGTAQFGNGDSLILLTGNAMFLAKYDNNGNELWVKTPGGNLNGSNSYAVTVTTDIKGNVYTGGHYSDATIVFGSTTLTNAHSSTDDLFIVKYDSAGALVWAKGGGGIQQEEPTALAADVYGNVYVSGYYNSDNLTIGTFQLNNSLSGNNDIFLAKYDSAGTATWALSAGGNNNEQAHGIAVDAHDNLYVTGSFNSPSVAFAGPHAVYQVGGNDIFVVKYDSTGTVKWAVSAGDSLDESANGIALSANGNVYITGSFTSNTVAWLNDTLQNAGNSDIFLAAYDTAGVAVGAVQSGGSGSDNSNAIAANSTGSIVIAGDFTSSSILFPGNNESNSTPNNTGGNDGFVAKSQQLNPTTGMKVINAAPVVNRLTLYPNPCTACYVNGATTAKNLSITDILGNNVNVDLSRTAQGYIIRMPQATSGVYFLHDTNTGETIKFIKM